MPTLSNDIYSVCDSKDLKRVNINRTLIYQEKNQRTRFLHLWLKQLRQYDPTYYNTWNPLTVPNTYLCSSIHFSYIYSPIGTYSLACPKFSTETLVTSSRSWPKVDELELSCLNKDRTIIRDQYSPHCSLLKSRSNTPTIYTYEDIGLYIPSDLFFDANKIDRVLFSKLWDVQKKCNTNEELYDFKEKVLIPVVRELLSESRDSIHGAQEVLGKSITF